MKKILLIGAISVLLVFANSPVSKADPITITAGDKIKLISYNPLDNAGIMTYNVYESNGNTLLGQINTFCIQDNVYINYGVMYTIESITDHVGIDGNNTWTTGGNMIQGSGNVGGTGTLNGAVDYLFHQYFTGAYETSMTTQTEQDDFQRLLWSLQGSGPDYSSTNSYQWEKDLETYNSFSQDMKNKSYGTVVLNIVSVDGAGNVMNVQNQLYDPIPEPATMLLFGSGLMGISLVLRKQKTT
jgi:PEP-CTERM motif